MRPTTLAILAVATTTDTDKEASEMQAEGAAINAKRVAWAEAALNRFVSLTHSRRTTIDKLHPDDAADCFADLLGDLRHYAAARGFDFDALDARGAEMHRYESAPGYVGD